MRVRAEKELVEELLRSDPRGRGGWMSGSGKEKGKKNDESPRKRNKAKGEEPEGAASSRRGDSDKITIHGGPVASFSLRLPTFSPSSLADIHSCSSLLQSTRIAPTQNYPPRFESAVIGRTGLGGREGTAVRRLERSFGIQQRRWGMDAKRKTGCKRRGGSTRKKAARRELSSSPATSWSS